MLRVQHDGSERAAQWWTGDLWPPGLLPSDLGSPTKISSSLGSRSELHTCTASNNNLESRASRLSYTINTRNSTDFIHTVAMSLLDKVPNWVPDEELRLYIGGLFALQRVEQMRKANVTHVLSVGIRKLRPLPRLTCSM